MEVAEDEDAEVDPAVERVSNCVITWEVVSVVFCSKVSNDLSAEGRRVSSMLSLAKVVFVIS